MAKTRLRKIVNPINKRIIKKRIIKELESMYVNNPGMNSDIDSYNYGIHDALERIKKIL